MMKWVIRPGEQHKEDQMSTSNPICQKCGLEMEVIGIGWLAVYMAYDPPTPYEVGGGTSAPAVSAGLPS